MDERQMDIPFSLRTILGLMLWRQRNTKEEINVSSLGQSVFNPKLPVKIRAT
jgi:hypothetical protein